MRGGSHFKERWLCWRDNDSLSGNNMRTKYTGLQISIHWLVFLLVIMA